MFIVSLFLFLGFAITRHRKSYCACAVLKLSLDQGKRVAAKLANSQTLANEHEKLGVPLACLAKKALSDKRSSPPRVFCVTTTTYSLFGNDLVKNETILRSFKQSLSKEKPKSSIFDLVLLLHNEAT